MILLAYIDVALGSMLLQAGRDGFGWNVDGPPHFCCAAKVVWLQLLRVGPLR